MAAQAIAATLIFRIAENHRRQPAANDLLFVRNASCFLAMQMGQRLLGDLRIVQISGLDHRNFGKAPALIEAHGET